MSQYSRYRDIPAQDYRNGFKNNYSLWPPANPSFFWIYMRDAVFTLCHVKPEYRSVCRGSQKKFLKGPYKPDWEIILYCFERLCFGLEAQNITYTCRGKVMEAGTTRLVTHNIFKMTIKNNAKQQSTSPWFIKRVIELDNIKMLCQISGICYLCTAVWLPQ